MNRDNDENENFFDKLEETLRDDFGLDERFDELEERVDRMYQEADTDQNPFGDAPFSNPFSDGNPFTDGESPFGGGMFSQEDETAQSAGLSEVLEEDGDVVVVTDLPGFEEDQVDLTADAERVRVEAVAEEDMYRDSLTQVFNLPVEVEANRAEATFQNGVLEVRLPKVDPDDQTTITIE